MKLPKVHLSSGNHGPNKGGRTCVMEYINNEVFKNDYQSDTPKQVEKVVAYAAQACNDHANEAQRQELLELVPRIATCAPIKNAVQLSRYRDIVNNVCADITLIRYSNASPKQILTRVLEAYDKVTGTNWMDRALPEIPPLMEQLENTPSLEELEGAVDKLLEDTAQMPSTATYTGSPFYGGFGTLQVTSPENTWYAPPKTYEPSLKTKMVTLKDHLASTKVTVSMK